MEHDFSFEDTERDETRDKFEIIAIKMDIHKNGILYLKELVKIKCNNSGRHSGKIR